MSYLMLMTGTGKYKVLCKLKIYFVHFHTGFSIDFYVGGDH